MKITFNDKQKLFGSPAVSRAESKAFASFAKFGDNVKAVRITVTDVNGPKGGIDKECRVLVKLKRMNDIALSVKDESLSKAVSNAINRAARSVARQIDRRSIRDANRLVGNHLSHYGFEM